MNYGPGTWLIKEGDTWVEKKAGADGSRVGWANNRKDTEDEGEQQVRSPKSVPFVIIINFSSHEGKLCRYSLSSRTSKKPPDKA